MKASELMIGDWVKSRGKIEQVREVYDGYICTDSFEDSHDYYFKPIPLTPKILERNGFKKTSDGWECYESDVLTIAIHDGISCDIWLAEAPFDHKHLTYTLPFPRSVHELQHALRLCGIEKEIVL